MNLLRTITSGSKKRRVNRGFTLVELIVVIALIVILAAVGLVAAIGYVKHSKFDKNEKNAITVYQTAQTAMSQMTSAGTIDGWIRDLIADDSIDHITALDPVDNPEVNETVGKTVYLTYNPVKGNNGQLNKESQILYDLLSGYFYDHTIFYGTISVEFYISMTYDANKVPYYSARVKSAFYSKENKATIGWDDDCLHGSTDGLPDRNTKNRYSITLVGYYDGTEASAKPQVVSVFLPRSQDYVLDGHIVGPTQDPDAKAEGYLFNLRNGETLDVSWAMFDGDGKLHGDFDRNEELTITLHDAKVGNAATFGDVILTIGPDTLDGVRFDNFVDNGATADIVVEKINSYTITRTSYDSTVSVKVKRGNTENVYTFPITVTKVEGDGRTGCPVDAEGSPVAYIEYSLSLDCMMIRSDETQNNDVRYNSERLFSNDHTHSLPRNIYATIGGSFDYTNDQKQSAKRDVPLTYAARAMDDPVYYTGMNGTTYIYDLPNKDVEGKTVNDDDNNNDEGITGKCIVNTLFGDAYYSTSIGGTSWSSDGGNAVITSYRHLYNIRWIDSTKTANYRIIHNLDWYVHNGNTYVSEVKVYMSHNRSDRADYGYSGVRYRSPAANNKLYVVSFPAICKLGENQTITSMSVANGTTYAINNVQMRTASFRSGNGGDAGYGLICTNYGTIYNLYINNLNIILANVKDGSASDYSATSANFNPTKTASITTGGSLVLDDKSIGGLVGYNSGLVGKADIAESENVIRMNNCIVMSGNYWKLANYQKDGTTLATYSTGGIIGYNEGKNGGNQSTYGILELRGAFTVVGGGPNVGGIIGHNKADTSARLITNGDIVKGTTCEYSLPSENNTGMKLSCIVTGHGNVGGAIGLFANHSLNYSVGHEFSKEEITYDSVTGQPRFPKGNDNDYQIDVTIPAQGLVLKLAHVNNNDDTSPVGGAIGNWNKCNGSYASIRVRNSGSVISADTSRKIACGAAVGEDVQCSTAKVFIDVVNETGSRIGSKNDTSGPRRVGGAYGYIGYSGTGRTIAINISNDGHIVAKGTGANYGEGAGGAVGATSGEVKIDLIINAVNKSNSLIKDLGGSLSNSSGTGGAIGIMGFGDAAQLTEASVLFAENHGSINGQCRVGGVVGNAPSTSGKIFAVNYGTISGTTFVGGAVGRHVYNHYGTIQSILDSGSYISGANFVGGAAGRLSNFNDNAVIKTIVRGNSTIEGSFSVVGGICGDLRIVGSGIGGTIRLNGDSSDPVLNVKGTDGIGGAIGVLRSEVVNSAKIITPDQSSTNKLTVHISGANHIGGAVGCLRVTNIGADETTTSKLFTDNALTKEILTTISVKLNPKSFVYGTGENVGGAVGSVIGTYTGENTYTKFGGTISVLTASGSTTNSAYIRGKSYVGGAVGLFDSVVPAISNSVPNGNIQADFSAVHWTIEATVSAGNEADVGGAVGYFKGLTNKKYGVNDNAYRISVNLGPTDVKSDGYNVGGAIGKNQVRNGIISVSGISGTVSGQYNVGGAIGANEYQFNEVNVTVASTGIVEASGSANPLSTYVSGRTPDGSLGDGSNVGGAVGKYSFNGNTGTVVIVSKIKATVNGKILGSGNNVGGAVGYCSVGFNSKVNITKHLIRNVISVLQGDALVSGADNVGGTIGFSLSNITNVKADISGTSSIEGNYHVGGAIGWTYAFEQQGGNNVLSQNPESTDPDALTIAELETKLNASLYKTSGRIANIVATISADYALQGVASIGGAVGQSGYKSNIGNNGNTYASPALINVKANINTGYLFDPFETGIGLNELNPIDKPKANVQGAYGNACIGGVIGLVVDGRINSVELDGTGGTVNTDSRYPCPEISMSGAVLLAAKGHSIGGIIGQIGLLGYGKDVGQQDSGAQNVTVSEISASDTLGICVVSMNDANNIGGWIGSGYGVYGGLGNRLYSDYKNEKTRAIYNVNNIKYIYSKGNNVGGFCGYSRGYKKNGNTDNHSSQPGLATWADINVNLKNATICGSTAVGGAFGRAEGVKFAWGAINVNLTDHTIIGDPSGSEICKEAGGAIGYLRNETENFGVPVSVTIDSTSKIWANGELDGSDNIYGVGGAVGRCSGVFARLKFAGGTNDYYSCAGTITVSAADPNNVSVYSLSSNVGGVIGVMENVNMSGYKFNATTNYWSFANNVTVQADGDNACVGGFAGKIKSLSADMFNCYSLGVVSVRANGENACTGGFAGYATWASGTRQINSCYTTAKVISLSGAYTGGFIGEFICGTLSNCYVGGHTFQGSYVSGEGNVTGKDNVGGFIGATYGTNNITIKDCYSTASVLGTGDNIGGFIGSSSANTNINNSYCTGRVIGSDENVTGSFAGVVGASNLNKFSSNQVMRKTNNGDFPLIGKSWTAEIADNRIVYADDTQIGAGRTDTGHPFDSGLTEPFTLRAVIGTDHYGDWPLPSGDNTINDAEVQIYVQTGENDQGDPIYDWIDFENDRYEYEFNGSFVKLDETLIRLRVQGETLTQDTDYIVYYRDNNKVGKATISFAGKSGSGYSGAISRTFKITAANIEGANAVLNELSREYTGARINPGVTVTFNGVNLIYGTDYTFAFDRDGNVDEGYDNDNINIGDMNVYIIGKGNYFGTKLIGQFNISSVDLSNLDDNDIDLIGADNLVYNEVDGEAVEHCPGVVVRYNGQTLKGTTDRDAAGYDYVISYENNTLAGTAYLVITGTADPSIGTGSVYTGVRRVEFTISPAVNTWTEDAAIEGWIYGETPKAPTGKVKFGEIVYEYYYNLECTNKIDDISTVGVGQYYVKVFAEDSNNYSGPTYAVLPFTITPLEIAGATVSINPVEYLYTGSPINITKENITVTVGEGDSAFELGPDDYTITSYDPSNHTEPGTVTVTITGAGNYKGTAKGTFTIYREFTVTFMSNGQEYDSAQVREGRKATPPTSPADMIEYRFGGWYTVDNKKYTFNETVTGDITLYAKWIRVRYVEFDTGDPNVTISKQRVDDGTYATRPADPVRPGYRFDGWYNNGSLYGFNTKVYDDITLEARWTPVYTITFVTGDGSAIEPQYIPEDELATLPADPPTWDGHTFAGWYSDEDCTIPYDFAEPVKSSFPLYAKWDVDPNSG